MPTEYTDFLPCVFTRVTDTTLREIYDGKFAIGPSNYIAWFKVAVLNTKAMQMLQSGANAFSEVGLMVDLTILVSESTTHLSASVNPHSVQVSY